MAVELDEYLHFNRFRALTLEAPIYIKLAKFPLILYRKFCSTYEGRCLQAGGYGGKWSDKVPILNSCFIFPQGPIGKRTVAMEAASLL